MNEQITGALFKRMVLHGAAVITAQKQAINDLNVFPVPDGDTGTNMSMTIGTAVTELRKSEPATVEQAASVTASALLRGARGNSGVILSLLFRGLSKALKGRETADAAAFAAAMQEGVSAAYKAVMKPAEGTVLTVSRLAAKQAVDTAAAGETDLERVLEDAIRVGYAALAQTTEMNPVLKKASPERRRQTSPPWRRRTSPSPSTRYSSSARPWPISRWSRCGHISTASVTVW